MNEGPRPVSDERTATNRTSPIGRLPIARGAFADNNRRLMKRLIGGLATTAAVSGAVLGLAGTAQADPADWGYGPHQWCPGQSMQLPQGPGEQYLWDMNTCHTWYRVGVGNGNLRTRYGHTSDAWDGPNPPPPPPAVPPPPLWVP
jgi:hypothetical protein